MIAISVGEILEFSLGNTTEKYEKAAMMILGPTKLVRTNKSLHPGSPKEKASNTLNIQLAEAHENIENEILNRL